MTSIAHQECWQRAGKQPGAVAKPSLLARGAVQQANAKPTGRATAAQVVCREDSQHADVEDTRAAEVPQLKRREGHNLGAHRGRTHGVRG